MRGVVLERAVWRWSALAALLGSAYLLASSWRYERSTQDCTVSGESVACWALDRWTGRTVVRALDKDAARAELGR